MIAPTFKRTAAFSCAVLLASALPIASRAADPIEIQVILPLTGSASFLGKEEAAGLSVIEAQVNKAGGIAGRPLKFAIADSQSSAALAVQLMNGVIAKKVPVVIGSSLVAECSAMEPLAKEGPVIYCLSPGVHPADGSYLFSSGISTKDLLAATARYFRLKGWKKVAIITSTDATGQDAEESINAAFGTPENAASESIVDREHFNPTDISVSAQMAHIRASGAQALIAWTRGAPLWTLLRGAGEAGLEMPILTSSSNLTYAQMSAYTAFMPANVYFPGSPGFAPNQLPAGPLKAAVARGIAAFTAAGMRPDEGHFLAWDATQLVLDAYKKYGPDVTAKQIRDYLAGTRGWYGMFGDHDYAAVPQRGVGIGSVIVLRWDTAKGTWVGTSKPGGIPL
jgi:branched-chain amino acid transport system substrate-binding protein